MVRQHEERLWRRDWDQDIYDSEWERYDLETLRRMIYWHWDGDVLGYLDHYYGYRPVWANPPV